MAWRARIYNASIACMGEGGTALDVTRTHTSSSTMASSRSVSAYALSFLGTAQAVLGMTSPISRDNIFGRASASCSSGGQLSCHNTSAVADLCCFNAPGGALLQTQFWDVRMLLKGNFRTRRRGSLPC